MTQTQQQDAVRFLKDQHDEVKRLFESITHGGGDQRSDDFETLVRLLAVHETAEEMVIYPVVSNSGKQGEQVVAARQAEEDQAKKDLSSLESMGVDHPDFEHHLAEFRLAVLLHASNEEQELFPLLEDISDQDQLAKMTTALKVAEGIAPTHAHKLAPEGALSNALVGPMVSVVDRALMPETSRYPVNCPSTTSAGSSGRNERITRSRALCRSSAPRLSGGSIATSAATWNRCVTSMSSTAPVAS